MKRAFACLSVLIFSVITSCNEENGNISFDKSKNLSEAPDFSLLRSSNLTEEELVKVAVDYVWFIRENLIKNDRRTSLSEQELNELRNANNDHELNQAIGKLGGDGENIGKSFPDYYRLAKRIAEQHLDVGRFSKLVAREK